MTVAAIIAGSGDQDVEVYATDSAGRFVLPTSATVRIVDLSEPESAADADRIVLAVGAATRDTTSTTTTALAGSQATDTRAVALTSAAGFAVGRRYSIAAAGAFESLIVDRISGTTIYARDPLRGRYATGATVAGLRVSATFPSARADDADELARRVLFGIDWTFVGVTGPAAVRTLARIDRRAKALRASVDDMLELDPQLGTVTHQRTELEAHLRRADRELTALLMRAGRQQAETLDGEVAALAVTYKALELAYRVLEGHEERAKWAGYEAKRWIKMACDGHQADDATEVTRTNDQVRPRRRALGVYT